MNEAFALLTVVFLLVVGIPAYCVVMAVFFGRAVNNAELSATLAPWRAFGVGLVNFLFFGTVGFLSLVAADSTKISLLILPTLLAVLLLGMGWSVGLTALARVVGVRLFPAANGFQQVAGGAGLLTIACLLPFVGWLLLLPYLLFVSLGAVIMSLFSSRGAPAAETDA
jgi:hypothetical protein